MDWADRVNESNAAEQEALDRFVLDRRIRRADHATEQADRTLDDTCEVLSECPECHFPIRRNKETGETLETVGKFCSTLCAKGGYFHG
jgi:hypothetical protein